MLEFFAELVEGIFHLIAGAFTKEGGDFMRDVGAILANGKVKNRKKDDQVCRANSKYRDAI